MITTLFCVHTSSPPHKENGGHSLPTITPCTTHVWDTNVSYRSNLLVSIFDSPVRYNCCLSWCVSSAMTLHSLTKLVILGRFWPSNHFDSCCGCTPMFSAHCLIDRPVLHISLLNQFLNALFFTILWNLVMTVCADSSQIPQAFITQVCITQVVHCLCFPSATTGLGFTYSICKLYSSSFYSMPAIWIHIQLLCSVVYLSILCTGLWMSCWEQLTIVCSKSCCLVSCCLLYV